MSSSTMVADFYELLGVTRDSHVEDIKISYRAIALTVHPDKNPDDRNATERFQQLSEAYATLTDRTKRQLYDLSLQDTNDPGAKNTRAGAQSQQPTGPSVDIQLYDSKFAKSQKSGPQTYDPSWTPRQKPMTRKSWKYDKSWDSKHSDAQFSRKVKALRKEEKRIKKEMMKDPEYAARLKALEDREEQCRQERDNLLELGDSEHLEDYQEVNGLPKVKMGAEEINDQRELQTQENANTGQKLTHRQQYEARMLVKKQQAQCDDMADEISSLTQDLLNTYIAPAPKKKFGKKAHGQNEGRSAKINGFAKHNSLEEQCRQDIETEEERLEAQEAIEDLQLPFIARNIAFDEAMKRREANIELKAQPKRVVTEDLTKPKIHKSTTEKDLECSIDMKAWILTRAAEISTENVSDALIEIRDERIVQIPVEEGVGIKVQSRRKIFQQNKRQRNKGGNDPTSKFRPM